MGGRPLDVLEASLEDEVEVRLKTGETYRGTLAGYDQHMNLVLDDVVEGPSEDYDDATDIEDTTIIRGDNVVSITP